MNSRIIICLVLEAARKINTGEKNRRKRSKRTGRKFIEIGDVIVRGK